MLPEKVTSRELQERIATLPRTSLAHLPTPLDNCPTAARRLGLEQLHIKRDDCTGLAFGGNKVRQHEFVLGDALVEGCDSLIQGSASQSNHSRQLAAAGAKLGLDVHLVPKLDHMSDPVQGNFLISHLFGAEFHPLEPSGSIVDAKSKLADDLRAQGRSPYVIGMGAERSLVLAAVAYVDAFLEILAQSGGDGPPDVIVTGSQGSTQAGLLVAARALTVPTRVIGINPLDERSEAYLSRGQIADIVHGVCALLDIAPVIDDEDIVNLTDYVGTGYGVPSKAGLRAIQFLGSTEGILLDPVYSAKAFSGLKDLAPQLRGQRVIFVHTGGLPAIFAYADHVLAGQITAEGT